MSQIIKVWMSLFLILVFIVTGIGCISASTDIEHARSFKADVVANLENSNYNADVINSCISTASDCGYALTIVAYGKDGGVKTYRDGSPAGSTKGVYAASVTLKYKYKIGFLNINTEKSVRGMAR